jgi:hypothetical protein
MAPIREAARTAVSAEDVTSVFEKRFRVSIDDVVTMFGDVNWRHAGSYGGNAWKSIGVSVVQLRAALCDGNADAANELVSKIRSACHNTGIVSDKLSRLDAAARTG